jgi:hypothetical protein
LLFAISWVVDVDFPLFTRLVHAGLRCGPPLNQKLPRLVEVTFLKLHKVVKSFAGTPVGPAVLGLPFKNLVLDVVCLVALVALPLFCPKERFP